jgi:Rrf2 family protein
MVGWSMRKCNSSMQLTRAADYGIRVMVYLASIPDGARVLLPALARATQTPESFLSKILQALARADLIVSRRGKAGGFTIQPLGRQASMYDVIAAIDGPIFLNVCLTDGTPGCERSEGCPAHPVWARARRAMLDVLTRALITEMATRGTEPLRLEAASILPMAR